jgi:protein-S-isoprenylcysteine O-methyltransferase Ste14
MDRPDEGVLMQAPTGARDNPGVAIPPPFIFAVALVIGFSADALLPSASPPEAVRWPVGGALLSVGLALSLAFFAAFRRAGTPIDLRKPTSAIVTTGPYRLSRNPGYLSLVLIYVGVAILTSTLWALAALLPVLLIVDRRVIRREENYLARKFGDEYGQYKMRTRRWI